MWVRCEPRGDRITQHLFRVCRIALLLESHGFSRGRFNTPVPATGDVNIYGGDCTIASGPSAHASVSADFGTVTIVTDSLTIQPRGEVSTNRICGIGRAVAGAPPTVVPMPVANITTVGDVSIIGGTLADRRSYIEATTLTMDVGGSLRLTAGALSGSTAEILSGLTDIDAAVDVALTGTANALAFIDTTGSANIQANRDVILNNQTRVSSTFDLTMIAGVNMNLLGNATITGSTTVNLVVDNLFPVFPQLGPGAYTMEAGTTVTSVAQLRIFTSRQQLNSILGLLNGNAFTNGPLYQDSNSERWCIYFFDAFGGTPFTVFYKDCLRETIQLYGADPFLALSELYRMLHPYDEYIRLALHFNLYYDRDAYYRLQEDLEIFSSYDYIEHQSYFIRLRNHNYTAYQYGSYIRDL